LGDAEIESKHSQERAEDRGPDDDLGPQLPLADLPFPWRLIRSGITHVLGLLFQKETSTRFQDVPYRGGAPTLQDLIAGQIDLAILDPTTSLPIVRAGLVKAYAVMSKARFAQAPEIPTVDEAGLPGFYASHWHGLWVPKRTPPTVITKLNAAVVDSLGDPGVRARLADLGQEIFPRDQQTPEALRAFQRAEIEKWWPIIKEFGIKAE
jgi:tripartite-type tricarboxylate transporter receptor subunit TctC